MFLRRRPGGSGHQAACGALRSMPGPARRTVRWRKARRPDDAGGYGTAAPRADALKPCPTAVDRQRQQPEVRRCASIPGHAPQSAPAPDRAIDRLRVVSRFRWYADAFRPGVPCGDRNRSAGTAGRSRRACPGPRHSRVQRAFGIASSEVTTRVRVSEVRHSLPLKQVAPGARTGLPQSSEAVERQYRAHAPRTDATGPHYFG